MSENMMKLMKLMKSELKEIKFHMTKEQLDGMKENINRIFEEDGIEAVKFFIEGYKLAFLACNNPDD